MELNAKVLVVGDSGVGKSSIMVRFCDGVFSDSLVATVGVNFKIRILDVEEKRMKLQIWDTAGQERYSNIPPNYFHGAQGVLLVYDVTDDKSFQNVRRWMDATQHNTSKNIPIILLGSKCDKCDEKSVVRERGQALADEFGVPFYETSAKDSINVDLAFVDLATSIKHNLDKDGDRVPAGLILNEQLDASQRGVCGC